VAPTDANETNPGAPAPGQQKPERTPGSAPSVVPLPSGADPSAKPGEHPLPEDAVEGYPNVEALYEGTGGNGSGATPVPDPPEGATNQLGQNANDPDRVDNAPAVEPAKSSSTSTTSSTSGK
jgi:hypothetical protein